MTNQGFDPKLTFVRCAKWNTHSCPNLTDGISFSGKKCLELECSEF